MAFDEGDKAFIKLTVVEGVKDGLKEFKQEHCDQINCDLQNQINSHEIEHQNTAKRNFKIIGILVTLTGYASGRDLIKYLGQKLFS